MSIAIASHKKIGINHRNPQSTGFTVPFQLVDNCFSVAVVER